MKNKGLGIIIVVAVILIIVIAVGIFSSDKREVSSIKHFYYYHSSGMEYNGGDTYILDCSNKCYATTKKSGEAMGDVKKIEVEKSFVDKLVNILNKYNVISWNGFDKSDSNVLDGSSFSLNIITMDNVSIDAHGYMEWPNNYHEFKSELDKLFESIVG